MGCMLVGHCIRIYLGESTHAEVESWCCPSMPCVGSQLSPLQVLPASLPHLHPSQLTKPKLHGNSDCSPMTCKEDHEEAFLGRTGKRKRKGC